MLTILLPPETWLPSGVGGMSFDPQALFLVIMQMPANTWLITKDQHLSEARELLRVLMSTSQGRPYLGAALGSNEFNEQFATKELAQLTKIATTQPQATFAALFMALSTSSRTSLG